MSALSFDLTGKTALVTGGTSGIGKAIAEALLTHNARVVVGSRSEEKVQNARQELGDRFGEAARVGSLDVSDRQSIDAAFDEANQAFGGASVLVNCAGANQKKPTVDVTEDEMRHLMRVNFDGAFYACQTFARRLIDRGGEDEASIINICSVTSFMGLTEVTPYACAKSALWALTRQLAVEWPPHGIRTNAIAPGFVPADQNRQILRSGDRGRRILENTPMARFGDPTEIADAAVYLASPAGRFINGECINIDGGFMSNGVCEAQASEEA